jgi:hypothetical protein
MKTFIIVLLSTCATFLVGVIFYCLLFLWAII